MPARTAPRAPAEQPCSRRPRPAPTRPPRAFLDLGAVLTAPGCARAWTREILWEWGLADLADTIEIVVSEMVTNSVNASRALGRPVIRLILTLDRGELAVLVRDDHPGAPQTRHPGADEESGRGLLLAEALSDRFGWYPLEQGPGKVTWAVLAIRPAGQQQERRAKMITVTREAFLSLLSQLLHIAAPVRNNQQQPVMQNGNDLYRYGEPYRV